VRVWDLVARELIGEPLRHPTGQVLTAATLVLPDGRVVVAMTGRRDGTVLVRDVVTGEQLGAPLSGPLGWSWIRTVAGAVLPDNRPVVLAGGQDGTILMWDVASGELLGGPLDGHAGWVRAIATGALGHDRLQLVSGGLDGMLQVWTLPDRQRTHRILLGSAIYGVALRPPDVVVAATAGGLLRLSLDISNTRS
jgi:WD40 repeat protein